MLVHATMKITKKDHDDPKGNPEEMAAIKDKFYVPCKMPTDKKRNSFKEKDEMLHQWDEQPRPSKTA